MTNCNSVYYAVNQYLSMCTCSYEQLLYAMCIYGKLPTVGRQQIDKSPVELQCPQYLAYHRDG